jgi:hypothetical protein
MSDKKIATEVLRLVKKKDIDVPSSNMQLKYKSLKEGIYTIPPQKYNSLKKLSKNDLKKFYNYRGKAVTGTGADVWILADKKAKKFITDINRELSESKSGKKVKKTAGKKSGKKSGKKVK